MNLNLNGKVALIAASSKGLGYAAAEALIREGARVVINGRRPDEIARAAQQLRKVSAPGGEVHTITGDLTVHEEIARMVKATAARFGQIDIVVTNSGGPPPGKFIDQGEEDWQDAVNSTLWPVVRLIRCTLPYLLEAKERGGGRIINIVSTSVKQPIPGLMFSNALRPAVIGLAKTLSQELGPDSILVNNVCPGSFDTDRIKHLYEACSKASGMSPEEIASKALESIPLGRLGRPEELGSLVAFLASNQANYITGQTICIDGGTTNTLFG